MIKGTKYEDMYFKKTYKTPEEEKVEQRIDMFTNGIFCFSRNEKGVNYDPKYDGEIRRLGGAP